MLAQTPTQIPTPTVGAPDASSSNPTLATLGIGTAHFVVGDGLPALAEASTLTPLALAQQSQTSPPPAPNVYLAQTGGNPFFKADPGLVLWTWIVFALTLLTLYKFAWKPILKTLSEREGRIAAALAAAEKAEAAAQATTQKTEEMLAEARKQGQDIIDDARRNAETLKEKLHNDAKAAAQNITAQAEAAIKSQTAHARAELQSYSAQLALRIAEKLMETNMDPAKNQTLVEKYLKEFK